MKKIEVQNDTHMKVEEENIATEENKNEETPPQEDIEMDDTEAQLKGVQKINGALFEVIVELQKLEYTQEQEVIQSRAFNRLLRNGHQLLQAYEELLQANHDLEKKLTEQKEESDKNMEEMKISFDTSIAQFQSQLQGNEIQMKVSQIEKDNLKKEINKLQSTDIDELKKDNQELKKDLEAMEEETKKVKDKLQVAIKEKTTQSDRIQKLRIEYDNYLNSVKKSDGLSIENQEIIDSQSKQIKHLIEESTGLQNQLQDSYTEMESIFKVNQELENKNKL